MSKDPRASLIRAAADAVEKKHKGLLAGSAEELLQEREPTVFVSTGSYALDRICAGKLPGGLPLGPLQGRVIHVAGSWSSGKSLLLDHLFKSTVDAGGLALCSEAEGSRVAYFAKIIGLDLSRVHLQYPSTLEEVFDAGLSWHDAIRAHPGGETVPILWGLDSLNANETERVAGKGLGDSGGWHYGGGVSEALTAGLRKVVRACIRYPTTFVMLNQTRDAIGMVYGPKKITPGGQAPHFYASIELMLSPSVLGVERATPVKLAASEKTRKALGLPKVDVGDVVGQWVTAHVTKTKVASTFNRKAHFLVNFHRGVHRWAGLLQVLMQEGVVSLTPDKAVVQGERHFASVRDWVNACVQDPSLLGETRRTRDAADTEASTEHP